MRLLAVCFAAVLACVGLLAVSAAAAPGDLDAGFGTAGTVITDVGPDQADPLGPPAVAGVTGVAVQGDGKILAVGSDSKLVRYNRDGSLDTTFDADGTVDTVIQGRCVAIQPDGKIVIAGTVLGRPVAAADSDVGIATDFAVARYNPDGTLDTSFGEGGRTVTEFLIAIPGETARTRSVAYRVLVQPDGKILVAGDTAQGTGGPPSTRFRTIGVARYTSDGSPDRTFGADGKTNLTVDEFTVGEGLGLQADGKIILATGKGRPSGFLVVRLLSKGPSAGALDPSFGSGGSVSTSFGSAAAAATDVVILGDDRIVAVGSTGADPTGWGYGDSPPVGGDLALVRYGADGSLDTGFGGDGTVTTDLGGMDYGNAIAAQDDGTGKLVVGGSTAPSDITFAQPSDFALARYEQNGSLDTSFGAGGTRTTPFGPGSYDQVRGLAVQPGDGKIVAAGITSDFNGNDDFALARYGAVSAGLSLAGSASPDPVAVGGSLTYTLTATNHGPDSARSVEVSDSLSTHVGYASSTSTQGACAPGGDGRSVSCALGDLASGASATMRIVVTPTRPGTATNSATVGSGRDDRDGSDNTAFASTTVLVAAPGSGRASAKLQVVRAVVSRSARRLVVLAPISRLASGSVRVGFFAAGRRVRFRERIDARRGRVRFSRRIPRVQAVVGTGILTIRYPGDADTRPQRVRLRVASGRASLALKLPRISGGRLRAGGTVSRRAHGVVRVQVEYVVDARTRTLALTAAIHEGRWRLDAALSKAVRDGIARREGPVQAYVLFSGNLSPRIGGEMKAVEVLIDR